MTDTIITRGFWHDRLQLNREISMPSVLKTFEDTGRVRAIEGKLNEGEHHHIFYESDLAKWIEAAFIDVARTGDVVLRAHAEEIFDKVIANQQSDGYLNSYFTRKEPQNRLTNLRIRHELYCAGHLLEAALAHARLDGNSRFLTAMARYVDFIAKEFGPGEDQRRGYPGHQCLEMALTRAYDQTGEQRYLELAKYFIEERGRDPKYFEVEYALEEKTIERLSADEKLGEYADFLYAHYQNNRFGNGWADDHRYAQSHVPPVEQTTAEGHAVRALYMYCGMADLARQTSDDRLLDACKTLWRNIVDRRMYVHGGVGSEGIAERFTFDYDLPNDTAYAETCGAISLMFFAERLSRIERNSEYADIIERALYNNVLAGVSLDGNGFFYSNYLECEPEFQRSRDMRHGLRDEYHTCSCCPPNVLRAFADLGRYVFSEAENGVEVHQFISADCRFLRDGQEITISQCSEFPWEGASQLIVKGATGQFFSLFIRVPEWDPKMSVTVNGTEVDYEKDAGYAVISRDWRDGDQIELGFDFAPRLVYANTNVRYNTNRVALFRGPLLYCLEGHDHDVPLNTILLPKAPDFEVASAADIPDGVILKSEVISMLSPSDALYDTRPPKNEKTTAQFIPYFQWANRGETSMLVWVNKSFV